MLDFYCCLRSLKEELDLANKTLLRSRDSSMSGYKTPPHPDTGRSKYIRASLLSFVYFCCKTTKYIWLVFCTVVENGSPDFHLDDDCLFLFHGMMIGREGPALLP